VVEMLAAVQPAGGGVAVDGVRTPCAQPLELETTTCPDSMPSDRNAAGYRANKRLKPSSTGARSKNVVRTSSSRNSGNVESGRYSDVYSGACGHIDISSRTTRSAPPRWLR
jgi:hypothetical protein